jgi:ABC-type antimicrobial peptide transport system permease subunit
MSVLLSIFTFMAIFIGCLGLFGLTTFMANQKTKEIGVRKVMGASTGSIVILFSREFVVLIGVGFLLAGPVSYYVMNEWLNEFTYKITLGPSIFVAGIVVTLLIALSTVGYRSFKAAVVNPADSLRSE